MKHPFYTLLVRADENAAWRIHSPGDYQKPVVVKRQLDACARRLFRKHNTKIIVTNSNRSAIAFAVDTLNERQLPFENLTANINEKTQSQPQGPCGRESCAFPARNNNAPAPGLFALGADLTPQPRALRSRLKKGEIQAPNDDARSCAKPIP